MAFDGQKRLAALQAAGIGTRRQTLMLARWGVYFLLGFTLACARVLETGGPFGMALVACAGPGGAGVGALMGASLGYLVTGGLDWSLRYIAACLLVYTVAYICQDLALARSPFFMPAAAALVMGMTCFLGSFAYEPGPRPLWAELFLESSLAFGGSYFFLNNSDYGMSYVYRGGVMQDVMQWYKDEENDSIGGTFVIKALTISPEAGDVNLGGQVNISDATLIQFYLAELSDLSANQKTLADVNGDGELDISDATELQFRIASE